MVGLRKDSQQSHDCDQLIEIIENAADAIISVDEQFSVTHFNAAAEVLFGYAADEIIGQQINILLPSDDRAGHTKLMSNFASTRDPSRRMGERRSVRGMTKDGRTVPLDISILRHGEGGRRRFTAIARDISAQIEAQNRIVDSERKFRAIFHGSYQFIALLDVDGRLLDINDTARSFVAEEAAQNTGKPFWEASWWLNELARVRVKSAVQRGGEGCFDRTVVKIRGRGERGAHVDLSVKPILSRENTIAFLVAEGRDITELMDTNEALRKSEASLAHAQRIACLGNWEWNIATNHLYWSDEVYRIFGLTPNTFGASFDAFLEHVHEEDRPLVELAVQNAFEHGTPYSIYHRIVAPDGTEKVVHERGEVLRNGKGEPITMAGTVQDVTEVWKREHELAEARDKAEAANRSKSQFLATMSHELRTPLNAIIGFSELIEGQSAGPIMQPQYRQYAQYVRESGQHLLAVINDILDVSRVELGSIAAQCELFDANALLRTVTQMVSHRAEDKSLSISSSGVDDDVELFLDERLCRQILINLMSNAIKFSNPGGAVKLGLDIRDDIVHFFVTDEGPGIHEDYLERIFEPFFQAEDEYARSHEGVGLGLSIVKKFAEIQGGRVSIDSAPDQGTRVNVIFPDRVLYRGEAVRRAAE